MSEDLSRSARRVQEALTAKGLELVVREMPSSTRTAQEAADAVGCDVAHIAKSLVFKGKKSGTPWLVVASGVNRVDVDKVAEVAGEPLKMAHPDFVRTCTGYAIGGVPPVGHADPLPTVLDADLMQFGEIWAAAGTPHALFRLTPDDLKRLTEGTVAAIS